MKLAIFLLVCILLIIKYKLTYNPIHKRIVVSLTTSPTRIDKIKPVLDCVMNQTVKPDKIYLNLPHVFKRDNSVYSNIPDFITNNKLIEITRCEDMGPATKILGSINKENSDTLFLSIDDDIYYPPELIQTYLHYNKLYPECVLTGTTFMYLENNPKYFPLFNCELLEGFSGVLYSAGMLQDLDMNFDKMSKECRLGDDFLLSNFIRGKKINILALTSTHTIVRKLRPLEYGLTTDALHKGAGGTSMGNRYNYKVCSRELEMGGDLFIHHYAGTYKINDN